MALLRKLYGQRSQSRWEAWQGYLHASEANQFLGYGYAGGQGIRLEEASFTG